MRPDRDTWGLKLALVTAQRATCCRRSVGCVLMNSRHQVLSTGYNGRAAGLPHCNERLVERRPAYAFHESSPDFYEFTTYPNACAGATAPSGQSLDACEAIHAEQNALLQCRDVYDIYTAYVTASPCITCVKLLLNTACERIVFIDEYPHVEAKQLWLRGSRVVPNEWIHMPEVTL